MTTNIQPSMSVTEIMAVLSHYQAGILPKEALYNAQQQWTACWPEIKSLMVEFIQNPSSFSNAQNDLLFMGIFLSVQQQEYEAYPLLVAICDRNDINDSELEYVLGDALTELLPSFFYILSQDNIDLLNQLITSQDSGGFVKSSAMIAIFAKYEIEHITRKTLLQLVQTWLDLFSKHENESSEHFLAALATSCIEYDLQEFKLELVRLATDLKIGCDYISPMEIEEWESWERSSIKSGFIRTQFNVVDELSKWAAYCTPEQNELREAELCDKLAKLRENSPELFNDFNDMSDNWGEIPDEWDDDIPSVPYIAPAKIGRNDLCPCNSGKKYKKCCME